MRVVRFPAVVLGHALRRLRKPAWLMVGALSAAGGCETLSAPGDNTVDAPGNAGQPEETVSSLTVAPNSATLFAGDTVRLVASQRDSRGQATHQLVKWSSANPAIATVDSLGLVTGVTQGTTAIAAQVQTRMAPASILIPVGPGVAFDYSPPNGVAGLRLPYSVNVRSQDTLGHTLTSFKGIITLTIGRNPGGGTLTGTTRVRPSGSSGVAQFDDLRIDRPGNGYTLVASGGGPTVESEPFNVGPPFGPAARLIAFRNAAGALSLVDVDHGGIGNLVAPGQVGSGAPAWSPDGSSLAFAIGFATGQHLAVVAADGSGFRQLTNVLFDYLRVDAWSHDGSRIFVSGHASGYPGRTGIWIVRLDGSGLTQLLDDPFSTPTWSPDASRMAFTSRRDGNVEIYTMNADGSGLARVTNDPAGDFPLDWSPDGRRIAFMSNRGGKWAYYVVAADGSGVTAVPNTASAYDCECFQWSPDGTEFLVGIANSDDHGNYLMNADGSTLIELNTLPVSLARTRWSPDSRTIYGEGDSPGNGAQLFLLNRDGSGITSLTPGAFESNMPPGVNWIGGISSNWGHARWRPLVAP